MEGTFVRTTTLLWLCASFLLFATSAQCQNTCDKTPRPCLDQPLEGQVKVTGSLTPKGTNAPTNAKVALLINGEDRLISGQVNSDGTFSFIGLKSLSQYDTVEVKQTAPAVASGAQPTTGTFKVLPNPSNTNLNLGISPTSLPLDFGHQAMQTSSAGQKVTLTNSTDTDVFIEDPTTTTTSNNYSISSSSCGTSVPKKGSCSFTVSFTPFSSGPKPGAVERDFVVIVPRNPEAAADYRKLRENLAASRSQERSKWRNYDFLLRHETSEQRSFRMSNEPQSRPADLAKPFATTLNAENLLKKQVEDTNEIIQEIEQEFQVIPLSGIPDHWKYPLTRAVVGVDLSAPSAQTVKQAYFVDFDLLAPLRLPGTSSNTDPLENRFWLWFNPRITSLPQAANFSALSTIDQTASFLGQETSKGTLGDIQGLDINGGFEVAMVKPRDGIPWWAEYANTQARLAPSMLVGLGMSTPFSVNNTDVVSQVNQSICDAFKNMSSPPPTASSPAGLVCQPGATSPVIVAMQGPNLITNQYIDFFTPERSRFFRKAYVGFRLKTYFFSRTIKADCNPPASRGEISGDCDGLYDIFPGTIDLTFGKDEAVTAGHFSTWLFRLDANYPLPFYQGIHIFASMYTALKRNSPTQPFNAYTINAPTTGANNDANTFRFGLRPLDRDYFRIGIGVDLIQVFKKSSNGGQPSSQAPAPKASGDSSTP